MAFAYSAPRHYLIQCWIIVNRTHMNKLQWNVNQHTTFFIRENASENIVREMVAILSREGGGGGGGGGGGRVLNELCLYKSPMLLSYNTSVRICSRHVTTLQAHRHQTRVPIVQTKGKVQQKLRPDLSSRIVCIWQPLYARTRLSAVITMACSTHSFGVLWLC